MKWQNGDRFFGSTPMSIVLSKGSISLLLITTLMILFTAGGVSASQSTMSKRIVSDFAGGDQNMGRGLPLADFESGSANLTSYEDEDYDPNDWEIESSNTYQGSNYALRMWGNSWKELAITAHPVNGATVFQAAIYTEQIGELQAVGFGDDLGNVRKHRGDYPHPLIVNGARVGFGGRPDDGVELNPVRF